MSEYIPPELIPNILARLPVDDVLRCTSVCKSWYSLITSPSFASSHLNLYSPNQDPRLLVKSFKTQKRIFTYCLHRDNQTFDEISKLVPPVYPNWDIIDSLNGLFCLYNNGRILLWNPSLRKSLTLPKPRVISDSHHRSIGFGFVATSNEYKVLSFTYPCSPGSESEAEIYELSTGSWRDLKLGDYSYTSLYLRQAYFNGIVHWFGCNPESHNFICSFNLKTERFGALMVPSSLSRDDDGLAHFIPYIFRESLFLTDFRKVDSCDIWVMKEYGVANSWQKLFTIDRDYHCLTTYPKFRYNGDLLFGKFCCETCKTELVYYDWNNNQVKNIGFLSCGPAVGPDSYVYTYAESLVLIDFPNEVEMYEESDESDEDL